MTSWPASPWPRPSAAAGPGASTFHDLLVLCRRLVRHPTHGERVCVELAQRYQALLLDEYQDTDPLQLDIVLAIATPPGADLPTPGQLFFVGDPKQSLYRFRRADIDLFLRTPTAVDADPVSLTTSFRATTPLIHWINHVFGRLITHAATDDGILAQPDFEALAAVPTPELAGSHVTILGEEPHAKKTRIGVLREAEAADVAATIDRILAEGWEVRPRHGQPRPARRSDIAILIPARTALGQLEAALRASGIAYRLDTGSLVYAADEVRALLMALRVVDDPTDELAAVSVLRTPLYGCSDVDLYRWRVLRGGRWNPRAPPAGAAGGEDAVWDAMADLEQRIGTRAWLTPSQQLDALVRDRRVLEAALAGPSPLDAWHRVRFVLEQARAWTEAGGRFLRDYLEWTRRQTGLTGRVAEAVLEDGADGERSDGSGGDHGGDDDRTGDGPGDDAVRILTVHGSKGLEFPITVVCGFNSPPGGRRRGVQVAFGRDGETILRLRQGLEQPGFDASRAIDEQMDEHERIRLLYVACTRARDHLVVSLHRVDDHRMTGAQLLARCVTAPEDRAELADVQEVAPALAVAPPPERAGPLRATARADGHGPRRMAGRARRPDRHRSPSRARSPPPAWPRSHSRGPGRTAPERTTTASRSWPGHQPRTTSSPAWPSGPSTSTYRRGARVGTAPPSGGRSTPSSRWSTWRRARASRRWPPPRPRPRASRASRSASPPWPARPSPRRRWSRPPDSLTGARSTWGCRSARPCWRATSTCCTAGRTASSWSTTRRTA